MTPRELFNYADRFASRSERKGKGTQYPTLRQAAKRFQTTIDEVEEVANEGICDGGYLGVVSGVGISGVGTGDITPKGAWLVEAYR